MRPGPEGGLQTVLPQTGGEGAEVGPPRLLFLHTV